MPSGERGRCRCGFALSAPPGRTIADPPRHPCPLGPNRLDPNRLIQPPMFRTALIRPLRFGGRLPVWPGPNDSGPALLPADPVRSGVAGFGARFVSIRRIRRGLHPHPDSAPMTFLFKPIRPFCEFRRAVPAFDPSPAFGPSPAFDPSLGFDPVPASALRSALRLCVRCIFVVPPSRGEFHRALMILSPAPASPARRSLHSLRHLAFGYGSVRRPDRRRDFSRPLLLIRRRPCPPVIALPSFSPGCRQRALPQIVRSDWARLRGRSSASPLPRRRRTPRAWFCRRPIRCGARLFALGHPGLASPDRAPTVPALPATAVSAANAHLLEFPAARRQIAPAQPAGELFSCVRRGRFAQATPPSGVLPFSQLGMVRCDRSVRTGTHRAQAHPGASILAHPVARDLLQTLRSRSSPALFILRRPARVCSRRRPTLTPATNAPRPIPQFAPSRPSAGAFRRSPPRRSLLPDRPGPRFAAPASSRSICSDHASVIRSSPPRIVGVRSSVGGDCCVRRSRTCVSRALPRQSWSGSSTVSLLTRVLDASSAGTLRMFCVQRPHASVSGPASRPIWPSQHTSSPGIHAATPAPARRPPPRRNAIPRGSA